MNTENAILLIQNLLDRLETNPETGRTRLDTVVTDNEVEAVRYVLHALGAEPARDDDDPAIPQGGDATVETPEEDSGADASASPRRIALCLSSLERDRPDNNDVILCLDFGTAFSKAVATRGADEHLLALPLGRLAGEPSDLVYPVSSTLFITRRRILFGREAIETSLKYRTSGRKRFESPKQYISQGEIEQMEREVDSAINPSKVDFTKSDLITMYLSFLTDLACSDLENRGISRYVQRRFAVPCWDSERVESAERAMARMLAEAQILADTFSGKWKGGLDIADVRAALDAVSGQDKLPDYLLCSDDRCVRETIAAASGSFRIGSGKRKLYMVIDVGAGTTDYELFVVVERAGRDDRPRVFPIRNTNKTLRQAGDIVDEALLEYILEHEDVVRGTPQYDTNVSSLLLQIREHKETLFREGSVTYALQNDKVGTVQKENFVQHRRMEAFSKRLRSRMAESIRQAEREWFGGRVARVDVVLTGGGAKLPMVQNLAKEPLDIGDSRVVVQLARDPSETDERLAEIRHFFPQLAVGIGGAARELPNQKNSVASSVFSAPKVIGLAPQYKKGWQE